MQPWVNRFVLLHLWFSSGQLSLRGQSGNMGREPTGTSTWMLDTLLRTWRYQLQALIVDPAKSELSTTTK